MSQIETVYKCQRPYHEMLAAKYLCVKPGCQESSICCDQCVNEYHKHHLPQELVSLNKLNQILNLQTAYTAIANLEQNYDKFLIVLKEELYRLDYPKQLQQNPSTQLLKQISELAKNQINYNEINSFVKKNVEEIIWQIEKTLNQVLNTQYFIKNKIKEIIQNYCNQAKNLLQKKGKVENAMIQIEKALDIDPQCVEALQIQNDLQKQQLESEQSEDINTSLVAVGFRWSIHVTDEPTISLAINRQIQIQELVFFLSQHAVKLEGCTLDVFLDKDCLDKITDPTKTISEVGLIEQSKLFFKKRTLEKQEDK